MSGVESCKNADFAAEALFQLLGVTYAKEGKKRTEFGRQIRTLGVLLDLEGASACIKVGHTPERRRELADVISSILEEGSVRAKLAESFKRKGGFEQIRSEIYCVDSMESKRKGAKVTN